MATWRGSPIDGGDRTSPIADSRTSSASTWARLCSRSRSRESWSIGVGRAGAALSAPCPYLRGREPGAARLRGQARPPVCRRPPRYPRRTRPGWTPRRNRSTARTAPCACFAAIPTIWRSRSRPLGPQPSSCWAAPSPGGRRASADAPRPYSRRGAIAPCGCPAGRPTSRCATARAGCRKGCSFASSPQH